jgi:trehalose 6-phosphate synthase
MPNSEFHQYFKRLHLEGRFIVVSNREPWMHDQDNNGIKISRPASGMVTGIEPIIRALGGTWVAHGSASADRLTVDEKDHIRLPPGKPEYSLRRIWLTPEEESGYYYGMANGALWPLCHKAYTRPTFARWDWDTYWNVNRRFCTAVLEEIDQHQAIVFIQDYHLALLPRLLRMHRPDLKIVLFWHIPWPESDIFRIFPWGGELLDGMLAADILGFQMPQDGERFLSTVKTMSAASVDHAQSLIHNNCHDTLIRSYPISVDYSQIGQDVESPEVTQKMAMLQEQIGNHGSQPWILVGADRLDYTKGIPERMRGYALMLKQHPELHRHITYLQIAAPSRTVINHYSQLSDELDSLVESINRKYQTDDWLPIHLRKARHDYTSVLAAYRVADAAVVSSLHDGMNLVAKEFVSARTTGDGTLILSRYTGAAQELTDAILVNPYDPQELADSIYQAFCMSKAEQHRRMAGLRRQVAENDIFCWGRKILHDICMIKSGEADEKDQRNT